MTGRPRVLAAVLWAGIEDFHGLWEYPWEVGGALDDWPQLIEEGMALQLARSLLIVCLADDLIRLHWCEEPYGIMSPISTAEAIVVLREDEWWKQPPDGSIGVRVEATVVGEDIYQRLNMPSSQDPTE